MKIKDKIKSYSFWVSLASAVILILKVVGSRFGFTVDESMVSDAFTAICSILVLLGIIVVPSTQDKTNSTQTENKINRLETQISLPENKTEESNDELSNTFKVEQICNNQTDLNNSNKVLEDNSETGKETTQKECEDNNLSNTNLVQTLETNENEITSNSELETQKFNEENTIITQILGEETTKNETQEVVTQEFYETKPNEMAEEVEDGLQIEKQTFEDISVNKINQTNMCEETNIVDELKNIFTNQRKKFSNNIDEYIFELQEELRKTRERM